MVDAMYTAPDYNKPETPGIHIDGENVVNIFIVIEPEVAFEDAAQRVFENLSEAQKQYPDARRVLYLEIQGHTGDVMGYTEEFFEFQQDFLQGYLGPFFTALDTPLASVFNPNEQRNDVPDQLDIGPPSPPGGGRR